MKDQPFLPVARAEFGRKTNPDLFGKPEVPFPLLTRGQKNTIRTIRDQRPGPFVRALQALIEDAPEEYSVCRFCKNGNEACTCL
jgi:hypothetical protein